VNRAEIEAFRRKVRELLRDYEHALDELEQDRARQLQVTWDSVKGSGREIALEAHARAYILDPILKALTWQISTPARMVVEDGLAPDEETEEYRRRLDYHGRDNVNGRSLLVVEAKRPNIKLPRPGRTANQTVIAEALRAMKADGLNVPVNRTWQKILQSAIDYAERTLETYGEAPARFALTNGDWFVVFANVNATLLADNPADTHIILFDTLEDVQAQAERFCELLSYSSLSGYIPPQHPSALGDFIADGQEAACARVVDLYHGRHGERQPLLSARVGIWVRRPNGGWVLFRKNHAKEFLLLDDDPGKLRKTRKELSERAEDLLNTLSTQRPIRLVAQEEFEHPLSEENENTGGALSAGASSLISKVDVDTYRIVTNREVLYLIDDRSYDKCPHHDWGTCKSHGDAVGTGPITAQSVDPPCFFPSGSPYHCAHATIYEHRKNRCLLLPFESFLCCRRCVFLTRCWPDQQSMVCLRN